MAALILGFYSGLQKLSNVRLGIFSDAATHRTQNLHSYLTAKVNTTNNSYHHPFLDIQISIRHPLKHTRRSYKTNRLF